MEEKKTQFAYAIISFFGATKPYKKTNEQQQQFLEDLALYICKG
jgi:hypothetical protein